MGLTLMEQMKVVGARFGDEESTLLDRFERLSFEIQLNQAILGRSLSQPATFANHTLPFPSSSSSSSSQEEKNVTKSSSRFLRAFNKLFHPKASKERLKKQPQQTSKLCKLKAFSRSLRAS